MRIIRETDEMVFIAGSPSNQEFTKLVNSTRMLMIYICGYGRESNGIITSLGIRRHLNTWIAQKPYARKRFENNVAIHLVPPQLKQSQFHSIIESCSVAYDRPVEQWVAPAGLARGKVNVQGLRTIADDII
jgi:hypothetical protein